MKWFTVTRSSGEKQGIGEFTVEDSEGVEWQVTTTYSKKEPGKIVCLNEVVCMNRGYECGTELRGDIQQAVKDFIFVEGLTRNASDGY